jgi:hypothetical protein
VDALNLYHQVRGQFFNTSSSLRGEVWAPRVNWPWGSNFRVEIKN